MVTARDEIGDLLDPILAVFRTRFQTMLAGHAVTTYLRGAAQMIEWGRTKLTDRPIFFEGPPMRQAIDYAEKHAARLVTRVSQETKDRLAELIRNGIDEKRGIDGLARDIRREFDDMTKYRSQLIARTETCDALEQSFMDRSKAMGVTGKEWVTTDPCPICAENGDAGAIPIDEEFPSGHSRPPAHPACMCHPGHILVSGGVVRRAYRRMYEGEMVEITTARGNKLAGTPNHSVLTDAGWVKLGLLCEGDNVISTLRGERMLGVNPNIDDVPTPISKIFDTLAVSGLPERMVGTPVDFHGDGGQEQVDIVTVDDALSNRKQTARLKHFQHLLFASPHRKMSTTSHEGSLVRREKSHVVGLPAVATLDISSSQSGGNDITVNAECLGQTKLRFPRHIALDDKSIIQAREGTSACARVQSSQDATAGFISEKTTIHQDVPKALVSNMIAVGCGFDAFSCHVIPDRIINVSRRRFAHYVYSLQTDSGVYCANGIIAHNCALAPVMLPERESLREGGEGSGYFGHAGRPGEVGGSGEGGGGALSPRAERARATYKVASAAVQRQAEHNEPRLASAIGGKQEGDNSPFDVTVGSRHVVEVKTIVRGNNDKITMHPESLARKEAYVRASGAKAHTVVFDDRSGRIYYKAGIGSFRLSAMEPTTLAGLRGRIR